MTLGPAFKDLIHRLGNTGSSIGITYLRECESMEEISRCSYYTINLVYTAPIRFITKAHEQNPGPVVIKLFFMLNSTDHEISTAHKN